MSKVRQSIRDEWKEFKIYPLEGYPDVDPTRYRVLSNGHIVRGEYYGNKAGLPMNVCYDQRLKMTYCNVKNINGDTCRCYCDDLIKYHKNYESKVINE